MNNKLTSTEVSETGLLISNNILLKEGLDAQPAAVRNRTADLIVGNADILVKTAVSTTNGWWFSIPAKAEYNFLMLVCLFGKGDLAKFYLIPKSDVLQHLHIYLRRDGRTAKYYDRFKNTTEHLKLFLNR